MKQPFEYDVLIVGGFGHVGLPMGLVLADAGFNVALFDIDQSKRSLIEGGHMPFLDRGAEALLRRVIGKKLHVANQIDEVKRAKYIVIAIGTPAVPHLPPQPGPVEELGADLVPHLTPEHCIVLRSTVEPGTTRRLHGLLKRSGRQVHVAYCPERIVQGFAVEEIRTLPQIISGLSAEAIESAEDLFHRLEVKTVRVEVEEAELAKLFCNAWRYIQFAISNQFYMMALKHGTNFERIWEAMTHEYDRMKNFPRPGFTAGPCLLKDTLQLGASFGADFQLGQAAININEGLTDFVVNVVLKQKMNRNLKNKKIGILGMAFKADSDDKRDSLSYQLAEQLKRQGASVFCSDEYIKDPSFVPKEQVIAQCEGIIVGVPHSAYGALQIPDQICVIDLWGMLKTSMVPDLAVQE